MRHVLERVTRCLDVVEIALGEDRDDTRVPVGVGVDVGGDVDAFGAPALDALQHGVRLAPVVDQRDLEVRELHADLCLATDGGGLVLGLIQRHVLAAHMAGVDAAGSRSHLGQRHQFGGVRVDARIVFQPAREAQRAGFHVGAKQCLHALHLGGRGDAAVVGAQHRLAHRAVPCEGREVDRGGGFFPHGEPVAEGEFRTAVHADDGSGDALRYRRAGFKVRLESALVVTVCIDEARRQHQTLRLHHRVARARRDFTDAGDEPVAQRHVGYITGLSAAVDNGRAADQRVGGRGAGTQGKGKGKGKACVHVHPHSLYSGHSMRS